MATLLDTGALELLRRRDRQAELLAIRYYPPLTCLHVVGEFLYGQLEADVRPSALLEIQEFLFGFECLSPDESTAMVYARIRAALQREGIKLPDPDYWVAAHAIQQNLPVLTTDAHFRFIPDVRVHLIRR